MLIARFYLASLVGLVLALVIHSLYQVAETDMP